MLLRLAVVSRRFGRPQRPGRNQMPAVRPARILEALRAPTRTPRASEGRRFLWLHLPQALMRSMSSPSAPESADWTSASLLANPERELSATSSGTPSPRPFSWPGWRTRPYVTRLSGTTLRPSTGARGAESWISSLRATRVSRSRPRASAGAKPTRATSGPTSSALPASVGRGASCSKTSTVTSPSAFRPSLDGYDAWVTASRRDCSRREKAARPISGAAYSLWPTPTTGGPFNAVDLRLDVQRAVYYADRTKGGKQVGIHRVAIQWTALWLFLKATGWQPGEAQGWRCSRPLHLTLRPGSGSSPNDLICNPLFLDWSMGWPPGWSDPSSAVTGLSRWRRLSLTALWSMLSTEGVEFRLVRCYATFPV